IKKEINLLLNIGEQSGNESDALEEFSMDNSTAEMQSDSTEDSPSDVPTVEPSAVDAKVEIDMSSLVADAPAVFAMCSTRCAYDGVWSAHEFQ
ncbi:MAG: hypothetical protein ACKOAH_03430, partial [Pirellula sp.]